MTGEAVLARLMAQAEGRGVDLVTLRALVEEASEAGATRALGALGLDDTRARRDMDELRELLSAWRDAKRTAWRGVVSWFVRILCAAADRAGGTFPADGFDRFVSAVRFAGYAAIFDRPDKGGDVVRAGAFRGALARAGEVPLLWQHDPRRVIGRVEHLSEDKRGLRVIASVATAREAEAVRAGAVKGLSFGYRVRGARGPDRNTGLRELVELDLIEISLVALPMQARAVVHAVEG